MTKCKICGSYTFYICHTSKKVKELQATLTIKDKEIEELTNVAKRTSQISEKQMYDLASKENEIAMLKLTCAYINKQDFKKKQERARIQGINWIEVLKKRKKCLVMQKDGELVIDMRLLVRVIKRKIEGKL